ncbi:unnamed protein product, partial [Brenthis ino]
MQELAKRGHEVTVITPDPAYSKGKAPQNLTEIDVHDISYNIWNTFLEAEKGNSDDLVDQVKLGLRLLVAVFEAQVSTSEVQKLIFDKKKKFDLIFTESCARLALSFSYLYDAPIIEFSSFAGFIGTYEVMGAASHPLIYPYSILQNFYNMTMSEKISQLKLYYTYLNFYDKLEVIENKLLKNLFGPLTPELSQLKKNVHLLFLNVHPLWDLNRPVPPNIVYLGGLHQHQPKELPKDLKSYLDSSKNGVIYMSFGTNVKPSLLSPEKLKIFINVFSQLPYDVLMKWDKDELLDCPKNIKIAKWYPQSDLLNHPKIKLFITQGGLQSTDEAITAGVPLIGVPMLVDQWFNTEQYIKLNIGIQLNFETLTEGDLKSAIITIVSNSSYQENVRNLYSIMQDQPLSPLERAVWWTEYVLRHKGALHLKAHGAHLPWIDYYELKLVLISSVCVICLLMILGLAAYFITKNLTIFNAKLKLN